MGGSRNRGPQNRPTKMGPLVLGNSQIWFWADSLYLGTLDSEALGCQGPPPSLGRPAAPVRASRLPAMGSVYLLGC